MTIRERINEALRQEPNGLTYAQLAARLDANEPSVRRAVKQSMVPAGEVYFDRYADSTGTDMVWKRR